MHLQIAFWMQVCLPIHLVTRIFAKWTDLTDSLVLVVIVFDKYNDVFVTSSSLELCATTPVSSRKSVLLSVCKMHALQCMGKNYTIAEDSTCKWPRRNTTGCTSCHMWETCEGRDIRGYALSILMYTTVVIHFLYCHTILTDQTNECSCKDSADCLAPGLNVCVRVGEDETAANQTMSECEAGLRRCKGEKVSVVSILPCTSWGCRGRADLSTAQLHLPLQQSAYFWLN